MKLNAGLLLLAFASSAEAKNKPADEDEDCAVPNNGDVDICVDNAPGIHMTSEEIDPPLPAGSIEILSSTADTVNFQITQKWKEGTGSISWIAPVFVNKEEGSMECVEADKNEEVDENETKDYTAFCDANGIATVVILVHDGQFKCSNAVDVYDCKGKPTTNVATYEFEIACSGTSLCDDSSPTVAPTDAPVALTDAPATSERAPAAGPGPGKPSPSGSQGDPHFKTWKNEHFEYHGQCDMVLVKDPDFADGLGLDVQIRTKLVRFWSYIKSVAIKIGDDIIEIQGAAELDDVATANYWMNFEYQGELSTVGGFPVTMKVKEVNNRKRWFTIDLGPKYPGVQIAVMAFREFIRVEFVNHSEEAFGNTVGVLGEYSSGKTVARDGETVLHEFSRLGNEWQVLPVENMLFHDVEQPQFPKKCVEPEDPRGERRRRLAEQTVNIEQAEAACASIQDPLDRRDCVYDVMATQDLDMVGAF